MIQTNLNNTMKSFIRPLVLGLITLVTFTCYYLFGGPNQAEIARQALSEQNAAKASLEATKIFVGQLGWIVSSIDTTYAENKEEGKPDEPIAVQMRFQPDSIARKYTGPLHFSIKLPAYELGQYEIFWKELIPGSEVKFDRHENPGCEEVYGYLIPRISEESARRTF